MTVTTHVLDTVTGRPATDLAVRLARSEPGGYRELAAGRTDADGRLRAWPTGDPVVGAGTYRLTFETGEYFARRATAAFHPRVEVVFEVLDATAHHHVPLLLSPFAYSTYRGS